MREVVVDASAFMKSLVDEPGSELMTALESATQLVAPDYLLIEVASVLWKKVRWGGLSAERAHLRLAEASRYDLELVPAADLLEDALLIACELTHPLYDALYLLLALKGGRALATADARMREAAEALGIKVEWVGAGID